MIKALITKIVSFFKRKPTKINYETTENITTFKMTSEVIGPQVYLILGEPASEYILDRSESCPYYIMGVQGKNVLVQPLEHLLDSSSTIKRAALDSVADMIIKSGKK